MSSKDGKRKRPLVPRLRFPEFREAGEWEEKRLGEVFTERVERGNAEAELLSVTMNQGVIRAEELERRITTNSDFTNYKFVWPGDIVYNSMRMWQGASGVSKIYGIVSPAYTVAAPNIKQNTTFWAYWFKHNDSIAKFSRFSQGVTSDTWNLKFPAFSSISFLVPSEKEQQRIADFLSSLDDLITAQAQKLEALKRHKKGLMQQLFPREGETLPRLRFPEFREAGEWEVKSLIEIGNIVTGKTPSTADDSLWNGDIQFVTPTDISEEKYQWKTQRKVVGNSKINVLPKYSIMFTCIASIGKISLSINPCVTNQQINTIIPNKKYENEFIYYSLLHIVPAIKRMQASSSFPIINKTEFSSRTILVPQSYSEQEKIADCLSSLDELIAAEAKKLDTLKSHKKGLIQQIFPVLEDQG